MSLEQTGTKATIQKNSYKEALPQLFPLAFLEEDMSIATKEAAYRMTQIGIEMPIFEAGREAVLFMEAAYTHIANEETEMIASRVAHTIVEFVRQDENRELRLPQRYEIIFGFSAYLEKKQEERQPTNQVAD